MPRGLVEAVCIVIGIGIGAAAVVVLRPVEAPHWEIRPINAHPLPQVWRLNTRTGHLELCNFNPGTGPECIPLPAPSRGTARAPLSG